MRRRGLGLGKGKGYYNLLPRDSYIHSMSAYGLKSSMFNLGNKKMNKILKDCRYDKIDSEKQPFERAYLNWHCNNRLVNSSFPISNKIPLKTFISISDEIDDDFGLDSKGIALRKPEVNLMTPKQFDRRFSMDYEPNEVGYATTKIEPDGSVSIFVKYYEDDVERTGKLLHHELAEIEIWENLVSKGMNPDYAEEVAHNKNPIKIDGVDLRYKLDDEKQLNASYEFETLGYGDYYG